MLMTILFMLYECIYQIHSIPCTTTGLLDLQNNQVLINSKQMAATTILPVVNSETSSSIRKISFIIISIIQFLYTLFI